MPIIVKGSDTEFTPHPEGCWPAVCCDVVDLGLCDTEYGRKHFVQLRWFTDQINEDVDPPQPQMVFQRYNMTLNNSKLKKHLERWRGKAFTKEEIQGFDLEALIGVNCQLVVVHNIRPEGRVWANVDSILKANPQALKLRIPDDYVRVQDRVDSNGRQHAPLGSDEATDDDTPF